MPVHRTALSSVAPAAADQNNTPCQLHQQASADVDEQAGLLRGWNQDYVQLSAGGFAGAVRELHLGDMHLFVEDTSRRLLQRGARPMDRLALGIPLSLGQGPVSFGGDTAWQSEVRESVFCHFSGQDGFEFMTPEGLSMAGLDLPWDDVHRLAADEEREGLLRWQQRAGLHLAPQSSLRGLRGLMVQAFDLACRLPVCLEDARAVARLRAALLSNALTLMSDSLATLHPQPSATACAQAGGAGRAARLVARAQDFLSDDPETPHTVATLCQALGVSRRTLQAAFQQLTGMAPAAFLRTLRLAGARRSLRSARSVAEAATQWGFWHLSLFAQDYRALYGELPSQTWRRLHGSAVMH
jgi:AraC family transcriptional regulator, ethanolamine operon transcriptional activator